MRNNRILFFSLFAFFMMIPFSVNANKNYIIKEFSLNDYVCEEAREHTLTIAGGIEHEIIVYDETKDKNYLIDLTKKGICKNYSDDMLDETYQPTEYIWQGNDLYLETYSLDSKWYTAKTVDTKIEPNSSYSEKKEDGFYHVYEPIIDNISNYYESYLFDLATGEYDSNLSYYKIIKTEVSSDYSYEEAVVVELDKNTYKPNTYYVLAKPEKVELINKFKTDKFIVPKEKSKLETDLTLSSFDFNYHLEFGGKKYYIFTHEYYNRAMIFDDNGIYQTFGLNNLDINRIMIYENDSNKYLHFVISENDEKLMAFLDESLNLVALHDLSEYEGMINFGGYEDNTFYYLVDFLEPKVLEVSQIKTKYQVTFDANGGKFDDKTTYVIDEWDNELANNLKVPTREGYEFKGYYTKKIDGIKFEMLLNEAGIDSDITFYAHWEEKSLIEEENPQTFDDIQSSIIIAAISLFGLSGGLIYLKKKHTIN